MRIWCAWMTQAPHLDAGAIELPFERSHRDALHRILDIVLGALDACGKCTVPASNNEVEPLPGPRKSRRQFGAVLDGNAA